MDWLNGMFFWKFFFIIEDKPIEESSLDFGPYLTNLLLGYNLSTVDISEKNSNSH